MTTELRKTYFRYLIAFVLTALSATLGNILDGVIVGQLVGPDAVAAVGTVLPITQAFFTAVLLLAGGGGMLVGVALGEGRRDRANRVFSTAVSVLAVLSLAGVVVGIVCPGAVGRLICTDPALTDLSTAYLRWVLVFVPFYLGEEMLQTFVAVDGEPGLVTTSIVADNLVNVVASVVLIKFGGLGIAGAAIGTAIGHGVACLLLVARHWRRNRMAARLGFSTLQPFDFSTLRHIVSQGAPLAIASCSLTALLFAANRIIIGALGKDGMFVFAVATNVLFVYNLLLSGAVETVQSLGAIEKGKGGPGFRDVVGFTYRLLGLSTLGVCIFIWIAPSVITRLFGGGEHPELLSATNGALRLFAPSFVLFCLIYVHMIVCKLEGKDGIALFISFALSLTVIPVLWAFARFAPAYIWWSYLVAYVIEICVIAVLEKAFDHLEVRK